ncbi:hypothetical protein ACP70R_032576 [Stipagrostis hirtigluma subsp. patula]
MALPLKALALFVAVNLMALGLGTVRPDPSTLPDLIARPFKRARFVVWCGPPPLHQDLHDRPPARRLPRRRLHQLRPHQLRFLLPHA